jgi:hypothetical protein
MQIMNRGWQLRSNVTHHFDVEIPPEYAVLAEQLFLDQLHRASLLT